MTPFKAAGILRGVIEWTDPREYLEAALYISTHRHHANMVPLHIYATATKLADYAVDNGEEAAVKLIRELRGEIQKEEDEKAKP